MKIRRYDIGFLSDEIDILDENAWIKTGMRRYSKTTHDSSSQTAY